MFQFTVVQHTHSLGVPFAFSKDDNISLFVQNHTSLCVKHNRTEGQ